MDCNSQRVKKSKAHLPPQGSNHQVVGVSPAASLPRWWWQRGCVHSGKVEEHRTLIKHLLCSSGGKQWISRASALPLYEPGGHAPQRPVTLIGPRSRGPRSCSAPPAPPPSRPVSPEPGDAGAPGVWGGQHEEGQEDPHLKNRFEKRTCSVSLQ